MAWPSGKVAPIWASLTALSATRYPWTEVMSGAGRASYSSFDKALMQSRFQSSRRSGRVCIVGAYVCIQSKLIVVQQ